MSWLGSGISQITGQLSTFTKEVLTEGTEEVDDVSTQLKIASSRVQELEATCSNQRAELDRLKHINEEIHDKLESSELQITALSSEYRDIVQQKEKEVQALKQREHELSVASHQQSAVTGFGDDFVSGFADPASQPLDEVVRRLKSKLQQVEAENVKFRQQISTLSEEGDHREAPSATTAGDNTADLRLQLKKLRAQLHDASSSHQAELASAHDVHSQKMAQLKRKHRDDVRKFEDHIAELQELLDLEADDETAGLVKKVQDLNSKCREIEEQNHKISADLDQIRGADREKDEQIHKMRAELDKIGAEKKQLLQENKDLKSHQTALLAEMDSLKGEREQLTVKIAKFEEVLSKQKDMKPWDMPTSTPMKKRTPSLEEEFAQESMLDSPIKEAGANRKFDDQVRKLQAQIASYEREIEEFELVRSDWQMEKEALEDVLLKLRTQLRTKEDELNTLQATKDPAVDGKKVKRRQKKTAQSTQGLLEAQQLQQPSGEAEPAQADEDNDFEAELAELDEKVDLLTRASAQLENERDILLAEKKILREQLEAQKTRVSQLEKSAELAKPLPSSPGQSHGQLESIIADKDAKIHDLEQEVTKKDAEMVRLAQQQTHADLDKTDDLFREVAELQRQLAEREEELANMTMNLKEAGDEKEQLVTSLEELDAQHQEAINQVIQTRKGLVTANEDLKKKVSELESQLSASNKNQSSTDVHEIERLRDQLQQVILEKEDAQQRLKEAEALKQEELREVFAQKQHELDTCNKCLDNAMAEKKEVESHMESIRNQLEIAMQENKQLLSKIEVSKNNLEFETIERGQLESEVKEAQEKVQKVLEENSELQKQLHSVKEEKTTLENEIKNLNSAVEEGFTEHSEMVDDINSLRTNLEHLTVENKSLKLEIVRYKQNIESGMEERELERKRMIDNQRELDLLKRVEKEMEDKFTQMNEKYNKAALTLNELHMEKRDANEHIKKLQADVNRVSEKLKDMKSERDEFESTCHELEVKVQSSKEEMVLLKQSAGSSDSNQELMSELEKMRQEVDGLRLENAQLKSKVPDLEAQLKHAHSDLHTANSSLNSFQSENTNLKIDAAQYRVKIEELNSKATAAENQVQKVDEQLKSAVAENSQLQSEVLQSKSRMQELEAQFANANIELQSFPSQLANYKDETVKSKERIAELNSEVANSRSEIQSLRNELEALQNECSSLKSELSLSKEININLEEQMRNATPEIKSLNEQLNKANNEFAEMKNQVELDRQAHESFKEETVEKHTAEITEYQTQVDSLRDQKNSLEKELGVLELKLQEQSRHYEQYIRDLEKAKDLNESGLREEHEKLMKECHEKELKIEQLMEDAGQMKWNLDDTKDMLQSTIDGQQGITDLLSDKEGEITALKKENSQLSEQNEERRIVIKGHEAELQRLTAIEVQYKHNLEEMKKLKIHAEDLTSKVSQLESKEQIEEIETRTLDVITDLESEITALKKKIQSKDIHIEEQKKIINALKETVVENETGIAKLNEKSHDQKTKIENDEDIIQRQDVFIKVLQQKIIEKEEEMSAQNRKLNRARSLVDPEKIDVIDKEPEVPLLPNNLLAIEFKGTENENGDENKKDSVIAQEKMMNGSNNGTFEEEIKQLKGELLKKSNSLVELQEKFKSLQDILDQTTQPGAGNPKLEEELRGLRLEKDQMMSILSEKSRECSQLKSEVHRLMNIVSAEKTALAKLQQDNQDLRQKQGTDGPNGDMTKEAVKKLSSIIRDKDMEIEALSQKNNSLLQVLQESGQQGSVLANLIQERDQLHKQVGLYQSDRDQIIQALNAKHQESLAYHGEIQRLNQLISSESEKQDKLQQEYRNLVQQYEDKQKALLNAQNELLAYKQKYTEVDNRYKEILREQEVSGGDAGGPTKNDLENVAQQQQQDQHFQQLQQREHLLNNQVKQLQLQVQTLQEKLKSRVKETGQITPPPVEKEEDQIVQSEERDKEKTDSNQVTFTIGEPKDSENKEVIVKECDHELEIESLKTVLATHEQAFAEKDKMLEEKLAMIESNKKDLSEKCKQINDKEKSFSELTVRFHRTEQMLRTRDTEIGGLKKQVDNLSFRITGLDTEITDVRADRERLQDRIPMLEHQVVMLKEANNKLSMSVNDKDFEINALKEKSNTLGKLLAEKRGSDGGEKGEMDRLIKETETLHQQAQAFKQDRDQFILALQQQQGENSELKIQYTKLSEEKVKLSREVERLRGHLLAVEEGYTQEALEAEEREKDLRTRLNAAEERVLYASTSVQNANQQASQQVEGLQRELVSVSEQRDGALRQLSAAQDQVQQYAASLTNLQMVLEQFQMEREAASNAEIERCQRDIHKLQAENQALISELRSVQRQLEDATEAVEAAQRLSEQLDKKEEMISALREEIQSRESTLGVVEEEIRQLRLANDARVEKALMRNLLIGYFHTPQGKRQEALKVLGSVLEMSADEMAQMSGGGAGWLGGLFRGRGSTPTPPTTPRRGAAAAAASAVFNSSFSQLFINYLEQESKPTPSIRLPADKMAEEVSSHHKKVAFNPFSTPIPTSGAAPLAASSATHPLHINTGTQQTSTIPLQIPSSSHHAPVSLQSNDLLRTSAMPVFAPSLSSQTVPNSNTQSSQGGSGQSTPSNSALLKDMLLQ